MPGYATHACMVCFADSRDHVDTECWPPRCCHGCGCGEERPADDIPGHDPATCEGGQCVADRFHRPYVHAAPAQP